MHRVILGWSVGQMGHGKIEKMSPSCQIQSHCPSEIIIEFTFVMKLPAWTHLSRS